MARCDGCGAVIESSWRFCPSCGRALPASLTAHFEAILASTETERSKIVDHPEGETPSRVVDRRRHFAAALALAAIGLTTWALFVPYYEGGSSLVGNGSLAYNLPALGAWSIAALLLLSRRTSAIGAAGMVGATAVWWTAYVSDVAAVVSGEENAGPGFMLGTAGLVSAAGATAVSFVVLWSSSRPRFSAEGSIALWAPLAAASAVAYAAGTSMSWVRFTSRIEIRAAGVLETGTRERHSDCCTLLDLPGWEMTQSVLVITAAALVVTLSMMLAPPFPATFAALSAAAVMTAEPLAAIVSLARDLDPSSWSGGQARGVASRVVAETSALPGLWITILAVGLVAIVAIGRLAHASARRSAASIGT